MFRPSWFAMLMALLLLAGVSALAWACPFCGPVSQTFSEEMDAVQVVVLAQVVGGQPAGPPVDPNNVSPEAATADVSKTRFQVLDVLKGSEHLPKDRQIEVLYFGQQPAGTKYLVMATLDNNELVWNGPVPLTPKAVEYVKKLPGLPTEGAERLAFFQDYLEDKDELLARDAYDEFAKAPYSDVKNLKDKMHIDKLRAWIQDRDVLASRRRLYLTMLGACGGSDDVPMLRELIMRQEPEGEPKQALDALIACYLTLSGPDGLPMIEDRFLKNPAVEYTETYQAIMALRFHGQEEKIIPKERLVKAMRHMLERPQLADLVVPDLARWQDWESIDRLVRLFKEADDKSSWVRVPVVQYLKVCPLPEAKTHLAELEKLDPESVRRASFFVPLGAGAPPAKVPPAAVRPKPEANESKSSAAPLQPLFPDEPEAGQPIQPVIAQTQAAPIVGTASAATDRTATAVDQQPVPSTLPAAASVPPAGPPVFSPRASWLLLAPLAIGLALVALLGFYLRASNRWASSQV